MTDIVSKFKSNQNKGIIWALLNDHNVFNGIENKYVNQIKTDFDNRIDHISNTISNTDNLVTLNKKVISEMMNEMSKYKIHIQSQSIQGQSIQGQSIQGQSIQGQSIQGHSIQNSVIAKDNMPITSADAQLQKQTLFQKNLETKKNEFEILINKPKPNTIDFADNNEQDKPNISEMERKLAETIAWREKQLNVVLDTQNKSEESISEASKWINRDNVSSSENNLILKIDKNTPVDINVINLDNKFKKKVSFPDNKEPDIDIKEPETFENNFLSLLKKKDTQHITHNTSYNLDEDIIFMKNQIKELMDKQNILLDKQNIILENQKVMLKIINELHIKPTDNHLFNV